MDESDRATQQEELARAEAMAFRKPKPEHNGRCMNCLDPLPAELVYCDRDCPADHERTEAARMRNGK